MIENDHIEDDEVTTVDTPEKEVPEVDAEPEKAEEAKTEEKEETKAEEEQEQKPAHIPKARFDEVLSQRNAERERSAELERQIQELRASAKPATEAPKVEAKDVDALELEYANLMLEGDVEKAVKLRGQINAEIRRQAEEAADQRAAQREAAQTQKAITSELQATANQIEKDYPYLSTEDGELVVPQITALRDAYIAKGMKPAEALRKAADFIAPKFDPDASIKPVAKTEPKTEPKQDPRPKEAIARGIKDSASQPPSLTGVGNRAIDPMKRDVASMTEEEFDNLSPAELKALKGL